MTANEIRAKAREVGQLVGDNPTTPVTIHECAIWLAEIAAQLAEANERERKEVERES